MTIAGGTSEVQRNIVAQRILGARAAPAVRRLRGVRRGSDVVNGLLAVVLPAVIGSPDAPFMNRTLATGCGLATNAHNETHPSLPNDIAATSGLPLGALGRWKHDCNAVGPCLTRALNLFAQAPSWGAYAESMPKPCVHFFTGLYAASHNPAVYYRTLADCAARRPSS